MVTLTCGCQVKYPKLTPSQIFHSWGSPGVMVINCPQGHGLLEIAPAPEPVPAAAPYVEAWAMCD